MRKPHEKSFLISFDYGDRANEMHFMRELLETFDNNTLIGCMLLINNNPYALEAILFLNFEKDSEKFESWISSKYPKKKRIFNYFIDDIIVHMRNQGYNALTFTDTSMLDFQLSSEANEIFIFADRKIINEIWPPSNIILSEKLNVFLSHSTKDKGVVDKFFNEIQKSEIPAWYDKYEISPGDSITDKINEGLKKSDIGIIFMSSNFINSESGWTKAEANYFFQSRMKEKNKNFIVINIDLKHEEIPPLMQDYLYLNIEDDDTIDRLIAAIKQKQK